MELLRTKRGATVFMPDGKVLTDYFWDRSRFSCIQGPVGSGTSTASMMKMWAIALEQEPGHDGIRRTRWIVTRPTYKLLRETTLVTWDMWFPETAWGPRIRAEPGRHDLINVKNGGLRDHPSGDGTKVQCEVVFLAIESAEHAREILPSYEITGFFQNEGQFSEKDITTLLLSRCDRWPSPKYGARPTWSGGFMDMNAPMEGHWVPYMRGDLPLPTDMPDEEKVGYVKPDNWNFYVQPPGLIEHVENGEPRYEENPAAENAQWRSYTYLEKIQGWPRTDVDQLVLNKIGLQKHGKPVYPTFVESEHINPKDVQPDLDLPIIVGLDFGREPAAVFMQEKAGVWTAHSELIGQNESAERFAPRVKRHLAQFYPGARAEFWGDPRGGDGTQATEVTAFDIFRKFGMTVLPATTDNSPELRRSTVEAALEKRGGLKVNPSCLVLKRGMAGGYHYRKIKGADGLHSPKPVKNGYSHVVEAMENALLGGGEGYSVVRGTQDRPKPVSRQRPRKRLRA